MSNRKVSELTETTTVDKDDLIHVVVDPATSPDNKKIKVSNLSSGPGNVLFHGADSTGVTDSLASIQAAVDAVGANGTVIIPTGTYDISGPILVSTNNTHIELTPGATLTATDDGSSFSSLEIDDTKGGMPQMKTMIAFRSCTDSSIGGGGTINAAGLVYNATDGMSGVYVRDCTRAVVDGIKVKSVFPSDKPLYQGEGSKRYTGILFVKCTSCVASNNFVSNIKYDCIAARMENTDIQIINNKCWDCLEGVQSSQQYGDVTPKEDNFGTVISHNEIWDPHSEHIVFHSFDVTVESNRCHTPNSDTIAAISARGGDKCEIIGNTIRGTDQSSDDLETENFVGMVLNNTGTCLIADNRVQYCHTGVSYEIVVTAHLITDNIFWLCNIGIDLQVSGDATTRTRRMMVRNNYIRVYRTGIRAQDAGPCKITGNSIIEVASDPVWVGTTIGLDLDPESNGDTEYVISDSLPLNFDTAINLPAVPNPPTSDFLTYFDANMLNAGDRYSNRGLLTITAGQVTGTDATLSALSIVPGAGELQVTQMTGTPTAFTWSSTASTITITIPSSLGGDATFGWSLHLSGFVRA